MQPIREIRTVAGVIDALGGVAAVARLFDLTRTAVINWITSGIMPTRVERAIQRELAALDPPKRAADNLFNWAVTNATGTRMAI